MEVFISFASGFAIGWASAWFVQCIPLFKEDEDLEGLYYNNNGGRTLKEIVDSKYDPENYFKPEGTE